MRPLLHYFQKPNAIFLIIIIGIVVYTNGIFNGFVNDDFPQITEDATVQSMHNIPQFFFANIFANNGRPLIGPAYYKLLMFATFSIIYSIFGANAMPLHILQLLILIAHTVLFFLSSDNFLRNPHR